MTLEFLSQQRETMQVELGNILSMFKPQYLVIPFYLFCILAEAYYDYRQKSKEYEIKDTLTNISVGLVSVFFGVLFAGIGLTVYQFCYEISPFKMPTNVWWAWVLLFFLDDFAYYWFHRISHESRFFWNFHVVHHSSEYYNLSVAVRQSWFGTLVNWMFYFPLALIGFPPWMMVTIHGLNLIYQFWIHTKFIKSLGWLELVLNTPSHHRVHHGVNNQYLDKNYGGALIIWDRIFGTFEQELEAPKYGIIKQLKNFNPLWINTHSWFETWEGIKKRKTLWEKIWCVFASPNAT